MSNQLSLTQTFAASPERIAQLMADRDYLTTRLNADTGLVGAELTELETTASGSRLQIRGSIPRAALPGMLAGFLSSDPVASRAETWSFDGTQATADFAMSVEGAPVSVQGSVVVCPAGDGCQLDFTATASTQIPMFGEMVQTVILEAVTKVLGAEEAFTAAWLAEHP